MGASLHSYFQVSLKMFGQVQVRALAGPLKNIQRLVPKPLLRYLGCVLRVVVLLEGEPLPQSEVLSALEQIFIKDHSVLCSIHLSLNPSLPAPDPEKHPHSMMLSPPCIRNGDKFPPDVPLGIQAEEFFLGFIRPENLVSHDQRKLLEKSKRAVMCLLLRSGFHLATTIKAWLVECCRDGCPSGRFSHLHRGTLEFLHIDHRVLGHLPDQGPSPPIAQFGWVASSRNSLGSSKLLPFKNDGGHCLLGDLQCSTQSCLKALQTIPSTSRLGFCSDMNCQLWDLI